MWTCPDCGRAFANRNQTHTCAPLRDLAFHLDGKPPEIAEIVALMPRRRWVDGHVVLARRLDDPRFTRMREAYEAGTENCPVRGARGCFTFPCQGSRFVKHPSGDPLSLPAQLSFKRHDRP